MTALFLVLGYLGVPVAFALIAGVLVGTAFTPDHPAIDDGTAVQRHRFRSADGDSVLPAGRRTDDLGQRRHPHRRVVAGPGGPRARRPGAGHDGVFHVLLRHVRLVVGRCRGAVADHGEADGAGGLPAGIHRRADRRRLHHRRAGAAVDHGGGVWRDRQCFDRRAVPRRHRAGTVHRLRADDLLLLLRTARVPAAAGRRSDSWPRRDVRRRCR